MFLRWKTAIIRGVDFRHFKLSRYKQNEKINLQGVNFADLLSFGIEERTIGVIVDNLQRANLLSDHAIPANFKRRLLQFRQTIEAKNVLVNSQLYELLNEFLIQGIDSLVIKGAFLSNYIYDSISVRDMSDIDILVPKQDALKADKILKDAGYKPEMDAITATELSDGHYVNSVLYHNSDPSIPVKIHLHWHFLNASIPLYTYSGRVRDEMWNESIEMDFHKTRMRILRPEACLLQLSEHAMKHSFNIFIHITDIMAVIDSLKGCWGPYSKLGLDEEKLLYLAKRWGLEPPFHMTLRIMQQYLKLEFQYKTKPMHGLDGRFFASQVLSNRRWNGLSAFGYLSMLPTLRKKVRFVKGCFFPGRDQLRLFNKAPSTKSYISRMAKAIRTICTTISVR